MLKVQRGLVLGVGNKPGPAVWFGDVCPPTWAEVHAETVTIDIDPETKPTVLHDLSVHPWPLESDYFDVLHAYEVLEHLTLQGDYKAFFALWREIWRVLKPGGIVLATTPWWQSLGAWGDPGHTCVYSPMTLSFLRQKVYSRDIGRTSMTDYRGEFPPPYNFEPLEIKQYDEGFRFILRKEEVT